MGKSSYVLGVEMNSDCALSVSVSTPRAVECVLYSQSWLKSVDFRMIALFVRSSESCFCIIQSNVTVTLMFVCIACIV